jgi:anaerobic selenocysteine-containing dehydrogenase
MSGVMHATPANRRPTAEQADARHREVKKHWRRQRKRRSEERPSKPDDVRLAHLRWRELQRLLRHRYGVVMPATDEARRDLEILIGYAVLTGKKVQHQVDLWAPWLDQDEADHLAAQHPVLHKADDLAHKLRLRYCDRQALAITTIGSVDVDQAERDRLRRQRDSDRKKQKRAATAKQQQEKTVQTHTAENLPPKEQKVLARIDSAEIAVPELIRSVASLKEFRKLASPRQEVHRVLDHLVAVGLVADRFAPGQKGPVRHVLRRQQ